MGLVFFIILVSGKDLSGVIVYCDLEDINVMIEVFGIVGGKVVVIGGGFLGFEVVVGLKVCGMDVIVLYLMGYLMECQFDEVVGYFLCCSFEDKGIDIKCQVLIVVILGEDKVEVVMLQDKIVILVDLVVMVVGICLEICLVIDIVFEVECGIIVSDVMVIFDLDVFVVGECVEYCGQFFGFVVLFYD